MEVYMSYFIIWKDETYVKFDSRIERDLYVFRMEAYGYKRGRDFWTDQTMIDEGEYFGWN